MSPSEKILTFPRAPARTPSLPVRCVVGVGPSVIKQDVARVVERADGSGRIEYWVKGTGWIEAPPGAFRPDEFMPGACLPVSARTAARLGIPAFELD